MFIGQWTYKIDEKGRLPFPPRFRASLKEGVVLLPGPEASLTGYPLEVFLRMASRMTETDGSSREVRLLKRALIGQAVQLDLDGQGRVLLPQEFRAYAELSESAVIIGLFRSFEIWSPARWESERLMAQEQLHNLLEKGPIYEGVLSKGLADKRKSQEWVQEV
jgi:MraZ protein